MHCVILLAIPMSYSDMKTLNIYIECLFFHKNFAALNNYNNVTLDFLNLN